MLRFLGSSKLTLFTILCCAVSCLAEPTPPKKPNERFIALLADKFGDFRALGKATSPDESFTPPVFRAPDAAIRVYMDATGRRFKIAVYRADTPSGAFAWLSLARQRESELAPATTEFGDIGIAHFTTPTQVGFCKGSMLIIVTSDTAGAERLNALAQLVAEKINGEDAVAPVLLAHLPDAEEMQKSAVYATTSDELKFALSGESSKSKGNYPALDALSFAGGTEAVTALYPQGLLVIAEHSSPQFAADAEEEINARIRELRAANQPVPSAFKRIGNYSVFVFDAPNEQAANQLLEQVKYEKDVRWLGPNPHAYERAARAYTEMTAQLIITVLKTTGVSILICLTVGGIFGGWVFMRRRARSGAAAAYSDAGGIVRLNLDELTPEADPSRLLPSSDEPASRIA